MLDFNSNGGCKLPANFFTCGWKPVLSWVCVFSVFWIIVVTPMIDVLCQLCKFHFVIPTYKEMPIMEIILATLGSGAIHTYDRMKGVVGDACTNTSNEETVNLNINEKQG